MRSFKLLFTMLPFLLTAQEHGVLFSEDYRLKSAVIPTFSDTEFVSADPTIRITVHLSDTLSHVPALIYGNNANVYMTQMVNNPDLIEHIRELSPNILRYPGGNLSQMFFWDAEAGVLPDDVPEQLPWINEGSFREKYRFGRNEDEETLSIDNYYRMLEMTGSQGLITVNYAYARYGTDPDPVAKAAHSAANWVRYDHGRTKFWEIGNENYGEWQAGYIIDTLTNHDGQPQIISGSLYGKHFKVFADSMRRAARESGLEIAVGCLLVESDQDWRPAIQKHWNEGFFRTAGNAADYFIIHSYFTPWQEDSPVSTILNSASVEVAAMREFIVRTCTDNVALKPLALTEWNIFAIGSKQQVSAVNGMHAALVLGELIKHQFAIACRWNLANGWSDGNDHGMFSQGGEPSVPRFYPRPVFHYMTLFQRMFGDQMVAVTVPEGSDMAVYASLFHSGESGIVLVNKNPDSRVVGLELGNYRIGKRCYWYTLTGGNDNPPFSRRVIINGCASDLPAGGPDLGKVNAFSSEIDGEIVLELPGYGTIFILVEGKPES
jgi:hypothetical protein